MFKLAFRSRSNVTCALQTSNPSLKFLRFYMYARMRLPKEVSRHQNPQSLTVEVDLTNLVRIGRLSYHRLSDRYQTKAQVRQVIDICIKVHFDLRREFYPQLHRYNYK